MRIASTGQMLRAWERVAEWKRWILCWILIIGANLLSALCVVPFVFPINFLKGSDYLGSLPAAIPIFAMHAMIFSLVPRGPKVFSGLVVVLYFLDMLMSFYNRHEPAILFEDVYFTLANLASAIFLWRLDQKNRPVKALEYFGTSFCVAGSVLIFVSALIGLGIVWGGMEQLIGKIATWIFFLAGAPLGYFVVPLYEGIAHGNWMPMVIMYVLPVIGAVVFGIGYWTSAGVEQYAR